MESQSTLNKVLTPEKSEIVKAAESAELTNFNKSVKKNTEMRIKVADILKNCADEATLAYFAKALEKINKQ